MELLVLANRAQAATPNGLCMHAYARGRFQVLSRIRAPAPVLLLLASTHFSHKCVPTVPGSRQITAVPRSNNSEWSSTFAGSLAPVFVPGKPLRLVQSGHSFCVSTRMSAVVGA